MAALEGLSLAKMRLVLQFVQFLTKQES